MGEPTISSADYLVDDDSSSRPLQVCSNAQVRMPRYAVRLRDQHTMHSQCHCKVRHVSAQSLRPELALYSCCLLSSLIPVRMPQALISRPSLQLALSETKKT